MIIRLKQRKNLDAYSLLEMLVSLGIVAIVMTMFSNILVNTIRISILVAARSNAREDLSALTATLKRDIRNADLIINCGDAVNQQTLTSCTIISASGFTWRRCPNDNNRVCKVDTRTNEILYSSSDRIVINKLNFEPGFESGQTDSRRNVLITVIASHANTNLNVTNLIYQTSISTRNYGVVTLGTPRATAPVCGNNIQEGTEQCDDGNFNSGDGCSSTCIIESICGNGRVEPGEQCDGAANCRTDCRLSVCGNRQVEPGEQCDGTPGCASNCTLAPVCGNGRREGSEECDDGNSNAYDGCGNTCLSGFSPFTICSVGGNGRINYRWQYLQQGNWSINFTRTSGGDCCDWFYGYTMTDARGGNMSLFTGVMSTNELTSRTYSLLSGATGLYVTPVLDNVDGATSQWCVRTAGYRYSR